MPATRSSFWVFGAYIVTLLLMLVSSYFPGGRVWGLSLWAYFPVWTGFGVVLVLLLLGGTFAFGRTAYWLTDNADNRPLHSDLWPKLIVAAGLTTTFFLFPAETHFGGDGYQLLGRLRDGNIVLSFRDYGTAALLQAVFTSLKGEPAQRALQTYQLVGPFAGIITLAAVIWGARLLLSNPISRLLFFLIIASGGFTLMFFGYVENYALLIATTVILCLAGVLATQQRLPVWLIPVIWAVTVFTHVLGIVFLPAVIWLLAREYGWLNKLDDIKPATRWLLLCIVAILVITAYAVVSSAWLFFKLAFLPIVEHQFTVDGYTLFSSAHLLDYVNLLFRLFPGLLCFVVWLLFSGRSVSSTPDNGRSWLLGLAVCGLGAAFVVDPKLGMVRDWNLLAFSAVPLVVLTAWMMSRAKSQRTAVIAATLVILLNVSALTTRAVVINTPSVSVERFKDYLHLDHKRSRNAWSFLVDYYEKESKPELADSVLNEWYRAYPEVVAMRQANQLYEAGQLRAAMQLARRAQKINPGWADVYSMMGLIHQDWDQYDTAIALIKTSLGLMPYRFNDLVNLATAYMRIGEHAQAEETLDQAARINPDHWLLLYNRARLARARGDMATYDRHLHDAAATTGAPAAVRQELLAYLVTRKLVDSAAGLVLQWPDVQADTSRMRELRERVPGWEDALERQMRD